MRTAVILTAALMAGPPAPSAPPAKDMPREQRLPQAEKPTAAQRHIPGLF